jgi:hypothetical protein
MKHIVKALKENGISQGNKVINNAVIHKARMLLRARHRHKDFG